MHYCKTVNHGLMAALQNRREKLQQIAKFFSRNPHLAKLEVIAGARLSPRQSFEAWQEDVRGRYFWDVFIDPSITKDISA